MSGEPTNEQLQHVAGEMAGTEPWEVEMRVTVMVTGEEDAQAVAQALGNACAMLPFLQGAPRLVVRAL